MLPTCWLLSDELNLWLNCEEDSLESFLSLLDDSYCSSMIGDLIESIKILALLALCFDLVECAGLIKLDFDSLDLDLFLDS